MKKPKLKVYVLEPSSRMLSWAGLMVKGWVLKTESGTLVETYTNFRKPNAIRFASQRMKAFWNVMRQRSELRIRNKNGTFGPARTYPSAADPRRSKG